MVTVTTYNSVEEMLANKTAAELILVWNDSERRIDQLKNMPRNDQMLAEWDALIRVRGWITKAMISKMPYDEFCKVVDIPND
jgi:cell division FtsZ-interacting protein ZapD